MAKYQGRAKASACGGVKGKRNTFYFAALVTNTKFTLKIKKIRARKGISQEGEEAELIIMLSQQGLRYKF